MSYNRRTLSPDSPFAIAAALMMFLSAAALTIYYAWQSFDFPLWNIAAYYVLPVTSAFIMSGMLLSRTRINLMPTILPVILGVMFFALRAISFKPWICALSCILYAGFAAIYILTVSGKLNTRVLLMAVSGIPFLFHVFIEDMFIRTYDSFISYLPELGVLLIMIALFIEAWGMRRGRLY